MYQTITCHQDITRFQRNLDALKKWADTWGMCFNVKKSNIITFNDKSPPPQYLLGGQALVSVEKAKYLGVIIQSDMRFNTHIQKKIMTAKQQLGMIKRALYWAPEKAKLLAYKTLLSPSS